MRRGLALAAATAALTVTAIAAAAPQPARAVNIPAPACTVAGWFSGVAGKLCSAARAGGRLLGAGGHLGERVGALGPASTATTAVTVAAVLAGVVAWVTAGAHAVLGATATVIGASTRPQLESSWFSASYWRMAAIALLLTVPFLFAACMQAILRSDPTLIARAVLGYLPLAALGITIAAPLTTMLLSASDGLGAMITQATGSAPEVALTKFAVGMGVLSSLSVSTFLAFVIGFITVAAALTLWVELLVRAAAVYVIVLMLPMFFAALVWPARRVWAVRSVEMLVALILSKFAIVAVLSLGGTAIATGASLGAARGLAGATLMLLAAFSPWALMRLLPMHELAAGVDGLRSHIGGHLPLPEPPEPALAGAPGLAVAAGAGTGTGTGAGAGASDAAHTVLAGLGDEGGAPLSSTVPADTSKPVTTEGTPSLAPDGSGGGRGEPPGADTPTRADATDTAPPAKVAPGPDRHALPGPVHLRENEYDTPTISFGPDLRFGSPEGFVPRPLPADQEPERARDQNSRSEPGGTPRAPHDPAAGPGLPPSQDGDGGPL